MNSASTWHRPRDRQAKRGYQSAKSHCYGHCTETWLPLIDRRRIVVANRSCHIDACQINKARLGTLKRMDGSHQVTYYGWPLYRYRKDIKTAQMRGQGKDGHGALTPTGASY